MLLVPNRAKFQTLPPDSNSYLVQQQEIDRIKYEEEQRQKEAEKEARIDAFSKELTAKAEKLVGTRQGQCVVAVRNFLGVGRDEIQGLAKNTKVNSKTWEVGAIVVFRGMSSTGHVGVSLFADEDNYLWYYDSNGDWRQRGAIRKIKLNDRRISGYRIVNFN